MSAEYLNGCAANNWLDDDHLVIDQTAELRRFAGRLPDRPHRRKGTFGQRVFASPRLSEQQEAVRQKELAGPFVPREIPQSHQRAGDSQGRGTGQLQSVGQFAERGSVRAFRQQLQDRQSPLQAGRFPRAVSLMAPPCSFNCGSHSTIEINIPTYVKSPCGARIGGPTVPRSRQTQQTPARRFSRLPCPQAVR